MQLFSYFIVGLDNDGEPRNRVLTNLLTFRAKYLVEIIFYVIGRKETDQTTNKYRIKGVEIFDEDQIFHPSRVAKNPAQ